MLADTIDALRHGRCVLCAGSRLGSTHGFADIVRSLLAEFPDVDGDAAEQALAASPLTAAGFIKRRLGDAFPEALRRAVAGGRISDEIRTLAALPFRAIVSTSYTDGFERALDDLQRPLPVLTPCDASELGDATEGPFLFKALGDPQRPKTVVWTAEDVVATLRRGGYRSFAEDLFGRMTFVFVGFAPGDPDLRILLDRVLADAAPGEARHAAVMPQVTVVEEEELLAQYGVRVLPHKSPRPLALDLLDGLGDDRPAAPARPIRLDTQSAAPPCELDAEAFADLAFRLRVRGDDEELIDLYVERIGAESSAAGRAGLLAELARILEREADDPERAFSAALAGYREAPDTPAWDDLERLARAAGGEKDLLDAIEDAASHLSPADRASAWVRAAHLAAAVDSERALVAAEQAVALNPHAGGARAARRAALRADGRWLELVFALERDAAAREGEPAAELFVEAAAVCEVELADIERALSCCRRAAAAAPSSRAVADALEALLRQAGDDAALADLLERRLDPSSGLSPGADDTDLRAELAALCERLGERERALHHWRAVAEAAPESVAALSALARHHRDAGDTVALVEVLGALTSRIPEGRERADVYREMATCFRALGRGERAAEYLEWALASDPGHGEAYDELAAAYRESGLVAAAIDARRRQLEVAPASRRPALLVDIARICEDDLGDLGQAIDAYREAEAAGAPGSEIPAALARLAEAQGEPDDAISALWRVAERERDAARADAYCRAAALAIDELDDDEGAEQDFARALAAAPEHLPALRGLARLRRRAGDREGERSYLERAAYAALDAEEHADLFAELGARYEELGDTELAAEAYRRAISIEPDDPGTARRLADILWDEEGVDAELLPLLERLSGGDDRLEVRRLLRLARAADAVGQPDRARGALDRAAALAPGDGAVEQCRGRHLFERGEWAAAKAALARALATSLEAADAVSAQTQLGLCALELGDDGGARHHLEAALAADPRARGALAGLARLESGRPEKLVPIALSLADLSEGDERRALLEEAAEHCAGPLGDPARALAIYDRILGELEPDHLLLHKCLDQAVALADWPRALSILDRLIATEAEPAVRAKYRRTCALIWLHELGDPDAALAELRAALADDPDLDRAAREIEDILRAKQDLHGLVRHLSERAAHLEGRERADDGAERVRVWSALGDTFARLGDTMSAIDAFEVAAVLEPSRLSRREDLAALCERQGLADRAIAQHQRLLAADPTRADSYRALSRLWQNAGDEVRAGAAGAAHDLITGDRRAPGGAPSRPLDRLRPLTAVHWNKLRHPAEDPRMSRLLALVLPTLAAERAASRRALGLRRRDEIEGPFADMVRDVARVLGAPRPVVLADPEQATPLRVAPFAARPGVGLALVVGAPAIEGRMAEAELLFAVAGTVACLRPERIARVLLADPEALSAIARAARELATGAGEDAVPAIFSGLPLLVLEQIAALGRQLDDADTSPSAALAWLRAVDGTAARAGLAIAGDLAASARALKADAGALSGYSERMADLAHSSITDELAEIVAYLNEAPAPAHPRPVAAMQAAAGVISR